MYRRSHGLVLGFHASTADTAKQLVENSTCEFKPSQNPYDWLGHGMYFWENSPRRAERFAQDRHIENPVVIGAVLQLGRCLDFTDSESLAYLKVAYHALKDTLEAAGDPLPNNKSVQSGAHHDLLVRDLDCAVINFLHLQRQRDKKAPFESVRGVFWEGEDLYPGAGFKDKNHIQICIRDPNCIKGFFYPRKRAKRHL